MRTRYRMCQNPARVAAKIFPKGPGEGRRDFKSLRRFHDGHRAPTKATPCHPHAIHPTIRPDLGSLVHQEIEFCAANLKVNAERKMASQHLLPKQNPVPVSNRLLGYPTTLQLADDVPCATPFGVCQP